MLGFASSPQSGKVIGFEKSNFVVPKLAHLQMAFEAISV
jgi:hypothetical protein